MPPLTGAGKTEQLSEMPRRSVGERGVCVAELGGECGFIGCLGDDDAGRFLRQVFEDNGVDVTFLRLDADLTSAVLIVNLTADGNAALPIWCIRG